MYIHIYIFIICNVYIYIYIHTHIHIDIFIYVMGMHMICTLYIYIHILYIYTRTKCIVTRLLDALGAHILDSNIYTLLLATTCLLNRFMLLTGTRSLMLFSGEERQLQNRLRDDHPATFYPNFPLQPGEAWHFDCRLLQICTISEHLRRICGDVKGYSLCRCCPLTWWFHLVTSLQAWSYNLLQTRW